MSNVFSATVRFGQDGELKTTQGGTDVLQVRAAFDSGWGDNKHTSWVTLVMFGKRATGLAPHCKKGGQAVVWGELKVREYNKNDGSKGVAVDVIVDKLDLVGGQKQQGGGQPSGPAGGFDSDVPFAPLSSKV